VIVNKHSSWEKKMADKAARKAFQEQKATAVEAAKEKRKVGFCQNRGVGTGVFLGHCCVVRGGWGGGSVSMLATVWCESESMLLTAVWWL
jgi:hypothetical protein